MAISNYDSQIAAFLARQPYVDDQTGADEPQVIFRGALELDRAQEQSFVDDTFKRIGELETELGYTESGGTNQDVWAGSSAGSPFEVDSLKHIPKRQFWDRIFNMKMGWRTALGGIYKAGQNLHMPFTRRVVQQMIARAQNYFFAAEPFCSAIPVGVQDPEVSTTANEWAQHKFKGANLRNHGLKAIECAGIRGEVVMKTGHRNDAHSYETYAHVLAVPRAPVEHQQAEGATTEAAEPTAESLKPTPLLDARGNYIIKDENDEWVLGENGQMVLKSDGVTPQPPGYDDSMYVEMKIRRQFLTYNGPDARPVDYRNFLAPLDAEDLQGKSADTVVHYYDMTAIEVVELFIDRLQQSGRWDPNQYPRTIEYLRQASSNSRASSAQPRTELGESGWAGDATQRADPTIRIAEVYRWYDATQTGRLDNIQLILDRTTRRPILYDHVSNVFDDGRRPFTHIQWWPVDGRWTGIGAVEIFWELQRFIDLQMNRWDLSLSESGGKTFFNPEMTQEGQTNPKLSINDQSSFRKRDPNMPAERILERVQLHEFKGAKIEGLVQFVGQLFTNMSGVANVNDAAAMNMDTAKLATGVNNMHQSGEEMFTPILVNMEPGITTVISTALAIAVEHMDEQEAFEVMGPQGELVLKALQKQDARQFRWHIQLEVSSNKGERDVAQTTAATGAAIEYYGLPPQIQMILAPLYRQRLKAHGIKNVDRIIVMPSPEDVAAWKSQQAAAAAAPPQRAA